MSVRSILTLIIAALMVAGIAIGTLMPPGSLPPAPGNDKMQHFAAFGLLVLVVTLLRPRWLGAVLVLVLLYGALIEVIQPLVGRDRDLADFIADALGIFTGGAIGLLAHYLYARLIRPGSSASAAAKQG